MSIYTPSLPRLRFLFHKELWSDLLTRQFYIPLLSRNCYLRTRPHTRNYNFLSSLQSYHRFGILRPLARLYNSMLFHSLHPRIRPYNCICTQSPTFRTQCHRADMACHMGPTGRGYLCCSIIHPTLLCNCIYNYLFYLLHFRHFYNLYHLALIDNHFLIRSKDH